MPVRLRAGCLGNGLPRIDYLQVKLDSHDVVLAEGASSESFVDGESRGVFHNAAEHMPCSALPR